MFKKLPIILVLMFIFTDGAFACCALCGADFSKLLWDLFRVFILLPSIAGGSFIFFIQGIYIFFTEKNKLALLRMVPLLMFIGWIFFNTTNY